MANKERSKSAIVKIVSTDEEIQECFSCLRELRPNIDEKSFCGRIRLMEKSSFRLACIKRGNKVVAVAGFRLMETLFAGTNLYVDDLITTKQKRSSGYGTLLIRWLREYAVANNCKIFHLDSGTQRARAHKFYFSNGLHINSYHFAEILAD